ncbi:MAG: hypothetical protein ACI9QC_000454 [Oceanicoccus sp.]|jgi:hypothetical protein
MNKLTSLILCLGLLSACTSAPVETPEEGLVVIQSENITYTNSEYGFTLELSSDWKNYTTRESELEWGDAGNTPSYYFGFEDSSEIFNISIHTLEQWELLSQFDGPQPSKLGQNEEWVFAGSGSQDVDEDYLDQRMEVSEILESFRAI